MLPVGKDGNNNQCGHQTNHSLDGSDADYILGRRAMRRTKACLRLPAPPPENTSSVLPLPRRNDVTVLPTRDSISPLTLPRNSTCKRLPVMMPNSNFSTKHQQLSLYGRAISRIINQSETAKHHHGRFEFSQSGSPLHEYDIPLKPDQSVPFFHPHAKPHASGYHQERHEFCTEEDFRRSCDDTQYLEGCARDIPQADGEWTSGPRARWSTRGPERLRKEVDDVETTGYQSSYSKGL